MNDHLPNDSQQDVENETLAQRLESCGLPGFNRACRYAESQNLEASVHFEQIAPSLSRLSLSVRRQGDAKASTYQVLVEENKQRVIHEQYFAADQSTRHEETLPSAINEMVWIVGSRRFLARLSICYFPISRIAIPLDSENSGTDLPGRENAPIGSVKVQAIFFHGTCQKSRNF